MIPITYLVGDATYPVGNGPKIIVHICNDVGAWGAGFVLALSKRWGKPEKAYRAWAQGYQTGHHFELGRVQIIEVENGVSVANLIGQHDIKPNNNNPPIRYDAVRAGLQHICWAIPNVSIHMPRIGCGLAGGSWDKIEPIIVDELCNQDIPVFVYDLPDKHHLSLFRDYISLVDAQRSGKYDADGNHEIGGQRSILHDQLLDITKMTRADDMYKWCKAQLRRASV